MDNLEIYEKVRSVPKEAQKTITGGRLNGMTDINPMWRIKTLTAMFGMAGIGWYTKTTRKWLETASDPAEVTAFVDIELYVKVNGEWSAPIEGTGGAKFVSTERNGLYMDDEAYKKAYTDAISVACKALGMGADVYWNKDTTKYSEKQVDDVIDKAVTRSTKKVEPMPTDEGMTKGQIVMKFITEHKIDAAKVSEWMNNHAKGIRVDNLDEANFKDLVEYLGVLANG